MAQLARGTLSDRPWGMTLGALAMRGLTGQVTVHAGGKQYHVVFDRGIVVGAHSPLVSDAAARVALTNNLITSTQVADISRRVAAAPHRDEIEVLAEAARLSPDQAQRLRRRLVAQRAARTFSPDTGEFVVDDQVTIAVPPGGELDVRTVIYLGTRTNLSEERLRNELAMFGGWFQLKPEAIDDLPQYGFTELEKPVLQMLIEGANITDILSAHPELDARIVRAVAYALVSCTACVAQAPQPPRVHSTSTAPTERRVSDTAATQPRGAGRATPATVARGTPPPGGVSPGAVPRSAAQPGSGAVPRTAAQPGSGAVPRSVAQPGSGAVGASRSKPPSTPPPGTEDVVRMRSPTGQPPMQTLATPRPVRSPTAPPPRRAKRNTEATQEIDRMLAEKIPLLDRGVDHFTLLGVSQRATVDEIRKAYFTLARKLHPDRLAAIGAVDDARQAQRLMAQINAAFAVLNDSAKRNEYTSVLLRGGEAAVRAEEARADDLAMQVMQAEEAFRDGEMALRRNQLDAALACFKVAVELQPKESEYQAMLAWAQFAAAPDKNAIAAQTRKALTRAAELNERSPTARFFLGRVERMLGKEREALQQFQEVLRIKPNHAEAASELRVLEQRLKRR